jgi:hypothetical protein
MAITVSCPHCAAKMRAPEDMMGRTVKCAACQKPFALPAASPPPYQQVSSAPPSYQPAGEDFEDVGDGGGRRKPRSTGRFADYLSFRRMITPLVIQVIFWIGVALILIGALISFVTTLLTGNLLMILAGTLGASLGTLVGILLLRIYCEIIIIFFRIFDTLGEIKAELEQQRR